MLEYYKLLLVRAGEDTGQFKKELRRALQEIEDSATRDNLRTWFKNRYRIG